MNYFSENLIKIETNLDDLNPEVYPYLIELLLDQGALDVWLTPIIMKKGRPATILTIICREETKEVLIRSFFRETTTLGIRIENFERLSIKRELVKLQTEFGELTFKKRFDPDLNSFEFKPEVRECIEIAKNSGVPLIKILSKLTNM